MVLGKAGKGIQFSVLSSLRFSSQQLFNSLSLEDHKPPVPRCYRSLLFLCQLAGKAARASQNFLLPKGVGKASPFYLASQRCRNLPQTLLP